MTFEESLRPFPYGKGSFFEWAAVRLRYYLYFIFDLLCFKEPPYTVSD